MRIVATELLPLKIIMVLLILSALANVNRANAVNKLRFIQLRSEAFPELYTTVYWPDGSVRVDSVPYTHASTFELHIVDGAEEENEKKAKDGTDTTKKVQLRAMKNNLYLSAENGGGDICVANRETASDWETFTMTELSEGRVQLQASNGNWVGVSTSTSADGTTNQLVAVSIATAVPSSSETFLLEDLPQQRGVNLGSWLVPEKWMFNGDNSSALWAGTSESVVDLYTLCEELGPTEAASRMNAHWNSWFTQNDFATMASSGVTHIRLPMGYWDMIDTPPFVFGGMAFIDKAVAWAALYNMTVLIDLHGAPGSQNGQDHSGRSGETNWAEPQNVAETVLVLGMMAERWAGEPNVWGFELLNEPGPGLSHELLTDFYREAYTAIRKFSADTHVVICSLYGPHDWTAGVLPEPEYRNAVLDLHLYTVWSGFTSWDQYMNEASVGMADQIRSMTPYYPVIVGEMSLATAMSAEEYTTERRQQFADAEFTSFVENAYGFYFWSDKLEYMSEDWSFIGAEKYVVEYYTPSEESAVNQSVSQ